MYDDSKKKKVVPSPYADIDRELASVTSPPADVNDERRADAIRRGAQELQIDPEDYATAISYETGGTYDPWQKGPVTKWGQHRGTIQYGEPQQRKHGVHQGQSFEDQVTRSNVAYLKNAGVKPGMSFAQIYAAINGGSVNKNLATPDVGTGRTIADNIRKADAEHRPKVRQRFGRYFQGGTTSSFDVDAFEQEILGGAAPTPTSPTGAAQVPSIGQPTTAQQPPATAPPTAPPVEFENRGKGPEITEVADAEPEPRVDEEGTPITSAHERTSAQTGQQGYEAWIQSRNTGDLAEGLKDDVAKHLTGLYGFDPVVARSGASKLVNLRTGKGLEPSKIDPDAPQQIKLSPQFLEQLRAADVDIKARRAKSKAESDAAIAQIDPNLPESQRDQWAMQAQADADARNGLLSPADAVETIKKIQDDFAAYEQDTGLFGGNEQWWAEKRAQVDELLGRQFGGLGRARTDEEMKALVRQHLDQKYRDIVEQYGSVSNYVDRQKEFVKRYTSPVRGGGASPILFAKAVESAAGGAMKVPFEAAASLLESLAIADEAKNRAIGYFTGQETQSAEKMMAYKLGNDLRDLAKGIKIDKDFEGGWAETLGNTAGQVALQAVIGTFTGGVGAVAVGGSMGAADAYRNTPKDAGDWTRLGAALAAATLAVPDFFIFGGGKKLGTILNGIKTKIQTGLVEKGIIAPLAEKAANVVTDGFFAKLAQEKGVKGLIGKAGKVVTEKAVEGGGETIQEISENVGNNLYAYATYDPTPERWNKATNLFSKENLISGVAGFFGGLVGATLGDIQSRAQELTPEAAAQAQQILESGKANLPEETYNDARQALEKKSGVQGLGLYEAPPSAPPPPPAAGAAPVVTETAPEAAAPAPGPERVSVPFKGKQVEGTVVSRADGKATVELDSGSTIAVNERRVTPIVAEQGAEPPAVTGEEPPLVPPTGAAQTAETGIAQNATTIEAAKEAESVVPAIAPTAAKPRTSALVGAKKPRVSTLVGAKKALKSVPGNTKSEEIENEWKSIAEAGADEYKNQTFGAEYEGDAEEIQYNALANLAGQYAKLKGISEEEAQSALPLMHGFLDPRAPFGKQNDRTVDPDEIRKMPDRPLKGVPVEEGAKPKTRLSNTKLEFSKEQAAPIEEFRKTIDPEDLVSEGLPSYAKSAVDIKPHVTVKYGLKSNKADELSNLLKDEKPITVKLGKTAVYPGAEKGNYDVIIAEVDSPDLHRLNKKIGEGVETDPGAHPEFKPHITIAYVKKGTGEKYAGRTDFEGKEYTFDGVTFAPADKTSGGRAVVPLGATKATEATEESIVNPIDRKASQEEKTKQLVALTEENKPIVEGILKLFRDLGFTHAEPLADNNFKKPDQIVGKANRPDVKAKKPWFDVEHIRDAFRFRAGFKKFEDFPKMMQIIKDAGIEFIKVDTDKFLDPFDWGWRPVAFDLRMPNGQLVEFYTSFPEMIDAQYSTSEGHPRNNHDLFEDWRNATKEEKKGSGGKYEAAVADSRRVYDEAYQAALDRLGIDEAAARASFIKAARSVGSVTVTMSPRSASAEGTPSDQVPSADLSKGGKPQAISPSNKQTEPSEPLPINKPSAIKTSESSIPQQEAVPKTKTTLKQVAPVAEETGPANSAAEIMETPKLPKQTSAKQVISEILKQFKRVVNKPLAEMTDKEVVDSIASHLRQELKWWVKNRGDYKGFYTDDIVQANKDLQDWAKKEHGRELTPDEISLYHLVSAFGSPSADPVQDSSFGLTILDKYLRTGKLTSITDKIATIYETIAGKRKDTLKLKFKPEGEPVKAQISRAYQTKNLGQFNKLMNSFEGTRDEKLSAAIAWLQSERPAKEIQEKLGLSKPPAQSEYMTKEGGRAIFGLTGTKLGSYFLNRTGQLDTVTKDLWYARSIARYLGLPLTEGNTNEPLTSPFSDKTKDGIKYRKLADEAFDRIGKELGMTPAEVQQGLWDFEKRLWEHLGHPATDRVFVTDGLVKGKQLVEAAKTAPPPKSATIGVAPLRVGTIKQLRQAARAFGAKPYKQLQKQHAELVKALGLTVNDMNQTVGAYGATSSDFEQSMLPTVSGPAPDVETYAALMATLAPETQHSALISSYQTLEDGGVDVEHRITFKTREAAEEFVANRNDYGISDLSYIPYTKTAILLEIGRFGGLDLTKFLDRYEQDIENHEYRHADVQFLEEADYSGVIQTARNSLDRHDSPARRAKLSTLLDTAEAKLRKQGLWVEPKAKPLKSVGPGPDAGSDTGPGEAVRERGQSPAEGNEVAYGEATEGAVTAHGVHYSRQPRTSLNGDRHGTGLKGAETKRLRETSDNRLKQRVYFYVDTGGGIHPEAGVGSHPHYVSLQNIYDAGTDPLGLAEKHQGDPNSFESAILDAGFDGYFVPEFGRQGVAVLMGPHSVPMETAEGSRPLKKTATQESRELRRELETAEATEMMLAGSTGGTVHKNGEIELSEYDAEIVRRLMAEQHFQETGERIDEQPFDGIVFSPDQLTEIAQFGTESGRPMFEEGGYTDEDLKGYDKLMKTLAKGADANYGHRVMFVYESALPHERVHKEDLDAGRVTAKGTAKLKASPVWNTEGTKFDKAYPGISDADKVSELAAMIASGETAKYGLKGTPAEQAEFLSTWAADIAENNKSRIEQVGEEAWAKQFPTIAAHAKGKQYAVQNNQTDGGAGSVSGKTEGSGTAPAEGGAKPQAQQGAQAAAAAAPQTAQGDQPTSGSAKEFSLHYEKVREQFQDTALGEEFNPTSLKEQAKRAFDFIKGSPVRAMRVAYGHENPPADLRRASVAIMLAQSLRAAGKIEQAQAVARAASTIFTEAAQSLNVAKLDVDDPMRLERTITNKRLERLGKKLKMKDKSELEAGRERIKTKAEKAAKEVMKTATNITSADKLLDMLTGGTAPLKSVAPGARPLKKVAPPISKEDGQKIKDHFAATGTKITDLYAMDTTGRRSFFEAAVGNEAVARQVNTKFERAMLSNQKQALKQWIWSNLHGGTPLYTNLSLTDAENLRNAFTMDQLKAMPSATREAELEKVVPNMGKALNKNFENLKATDNLANWERKAFATDELLRNKKLKGAFARLETMNNLGVLTPAQTAKFMEDYVADKLGVTVTAEESIEIAKRTEAVTRAFELANTDWTADNRAAVMDYYKKRSELEKYLAKLSPEQLRDVFLDLTARGSLLLKAATAVGNLVYQIVPATMQVVIKRFATGTQIPGDYTALEKLWSALAGRFGSGMGAKKFVAHMKMATEIYIKTGYDISRMSSLDDGFRYFGERFTHSEGPSFKESEGIKAKLGAIVRGQAKIMTPGLKYFAGFTDMLIANAHRFDTTVMLAKTTASREEASGNLTGTKKDRVESLFKEAMSPDASSEEGGYIREAGLMDANHANFTNKDVYGDSLATGLRKVLGLGSESLGKANLPFAKIPAQAAGVGLEMATLAGVARGAYQLYQAAQMDRGNERNLKFAEGIGRMLLSAGGLGIAAAIMAGLLDDDDYIGAYETDDRVKNGMDKMENAGANMVRIGGTWISTKWLGPLGLAVSGMMQARQSLRKERSLASGAIGYGRGMLAGLLEFPGFKEIGDWKEAVEKAAKSDSHEKIAKELHTTPSDFGKWIASRTLSRTITEDIWGLGVGPAVGAEMGVKQPKTDLLGRELPQSAALSFFFGVNVKKDTSNEITKEFGKLYQAGATPTLGDPDSKSAKAVEKQMGEKVYAKFLLGLKKDFAKEVEALIQTPDYKNSTPKEKKEMIDDVREETIMDPIREEAPEDEEE